MWLDRVPISEIHYFWFYGLYFKVNKTLSKVYLKTEKPPHTTHTCDMDQWKRRQNADHEKQPEHFPVAFHLIAARSKFSNIKI